MSKYKDAARKLGSIAATLANGSPPVNKDRAEAIMLGVSKIRELADIISRECAKQIVDSEVEPGPEGRAAIIEEREANGFRQIVAGPKTTQRTEVVS
jgi:hypothetical protein